ncbi:MAG: FAD-dependent thymidylate synthase [Clostridia bacterium]|nr:FAD-dependent thymidylate synthase [Clostridia bacterium]
MNRSRAVIIVENRPGLRVAAASARISTQQGTAMEIFDRSLGDEKDLKLIGKVLSSGHKSVIEHQNVSIAFNDVSVLVEQFVIECRLASFTVKSRRYVDFSEAGWVCPEGLSEAQKAMFDRQMSARFEDYRRLMEMGVPKEDARFVLPYALRSNFFMTVNARELIALIGAMLYGRGKGYAEIESLGRQLMAQFDVLYPGVLEREAARYPGCAALPLPSDIAPGTDRAGDAVLVAAPKDPMALLDAGLAFGGRFDRDDLCGLLRDARPRELELLDYTFHIKRISLACLTHFTRHRIVSLLIPPVAAALAGGDYVLPATVSAIPGAEAIYRHAFEDQAREAQASGLPMEVLSYYAMSGHELDVMLTMNAREIQHFMMLRTCSRAQWEIRGVAMRMLEALKASAPALFGLYGPSCRFGPCPEGKMSCGKPWARIGGDGRDEA